MVIVGRRLIQFFSVCVTSLALLLLGCIEKYTEQGEILYDKIYEHLIERRICPTIEECKTELDIHGAYHNQVKYTVFSKKNRQAALGAFTEFVVENGTEITNGVPISMTIYVKSGEESWRNTFSSKTVIEMEIKK